MNDDNNNNNNNESNILLLLLKFIKKDPIKSGTTLASIIHFLITICIVIFVLMAIALVPTMLSEGFNEFIHNSTSNISEWVTSWGDKVGNLFSGYGFYSNQEAATIQEEKYYKKLQSVFDKYKKNYDVEIDTTMITATLFAFRTDELVEESDISGDYYTQQADFYKQAKNQIETLAKFQLVMNVTTNFCSDSDSNIYYYPNEGDVKQVANSWVSVDGRAWSSRLTVNIEKNGDDLIPCAYTNVEPYLRGNSELNQSYETYSKNREEYSQAKKVYDTCIDKAISDAEKDKYDDCVDSACSDCDSYEEGSSYHASCWASCGSTCSGELTEIEKNSVISKNCLIESDKLSYATDTLKKNWLVAPNNYFEDIDGICDSGEACYHDDKSSSKTLSSEAAFFCIDTGSYGKLDRYDDAQKYRNYTPLTLGINEALINQFNNNSNFVGLINSINSRTSGLCNGEKCNNTICSMKPAIQMGFTIDNFAEEGVYYWKLLSNLNRSGVFNFENVKVDTDGSFIKQYYFPKEDNVSEQELINKVDEIFGIYRTIAQDRVNNAQYAVNYGAGTIEVPPGDDIAQVIETYQRDNRLPLTFTNFDGVGLNATGIGTLKDYYSRTGSDYNLFWGTNNRYFYDGQGGTNIDQCTGYAYGRALEILMSTGKSLEEANALAYPALAGNAGTWFQSNGKVKSFSSSTNVNDPRVGAIIVWKDDGTDPQYPGCGHVAIVEKIIRDENGNITDLLVSDGGTSYNGFKYHTLPMSYIKHHGSKDFIGYIYLMK